MFCTVCTELEGGVLQSIEGEGFPDVDVSDKLEVGGMCSWLPAAPFLYDSA